MNVAAMLFLILAAVVAANAVAVVMVRHPLQGALHLVGAMAGLGGIYALLHAPFLAVLQILVYAGAIMVLLVFVIMVLNGARDGFTPRPRPVDLFLLLLPLTGFVAASWVLVRHGPTETSTGAVRGTVAAVAQGLFDFTSDGRGGWVLLLVGSLALVVAIVVSVLLTKRELTTVVEENEA